MGTHKHHSMGHSAYIGYGVQSVPPMSRGLPLLTISFAAGLILGTHIPFLLQPIGLVLSMVGAVCLGLWNTRALIVACGFVAGASVMVAEIREFEMSRLPVALQGKTLSIEGRIVGLVAGGHNRQVFSFAPRAVQTTDTHLTANWRPRVVRVSYFGSNVQFKSDQYWRLQLKLRSPPSIGTLGSFDIERWMFQTSIDAFGTVRESPQPLLLQPARGWRRDVIRSDMRDRLKSLSQNHESADLLVALAIGDSSGLSDEHWQLLRDTGTAHLVAISGLHVGLVASLAYALCGLGWRNISGLQKLLSLRHFRLFGALLAAGAYAWLAGFALPTIRAVLMLAVFTLAQASGRYVTPTLVLGCALLGVLILNPLSTLSPGFWLSFGTVGFIIYLCRGRIEPHRYWVQPVRIHFLLGACLIPITVWFFQSASLISPVANLIAVPLISFAVVPLLLLGTVLSPFLLSVSKALVSICLWMLSAMEFVLQHVSSLPLSVLTVALGSTLVLGSCILAMVLALAPRGWPVRWAAFLIFLPVSVAFWVSPFENSLELHVLDVGQGQSVVLFAGDTVVLYDTGGELGQHNAFESVVMPFLRKSGRSTIDHAFISHPDKDHAAGAADLRRHFPDIDIVTSKPLEIAVSNAIRCEAGQRWKFNELQLTVLHPAVHDNGSDNNQSCVVLATFGSSSILLTGDIEAPAERALARRVGPFPIMIMTAPHHGSATSSSAALLDTFQPETVVVSAARRNAYGFPHSDVQMRYKLAGVTVLETGLHGSLSFRFGRTGLIAPPKSFWQERARPWHESFQLGS